jgi:hypothetical protein
VFTSWLPLGFEPIEIEADDAAHRVAGASALCSYPNSNRSSGGRWHTSELLRASFLSIYRGPDPKDQESFPLDLLPRNPEFEQGV